MELPYRTKKQQQLTDELNQLDRLYRSILMSTRDIPSQTPLPKPLKSRIIKLINDDKVFKLSRVLEEQAIAFDREVGARGSRWNIIHQCAKSNAVLSITWALKKQYQEISDEYRQLVNMKTVEGYTPIMVAIMNKAHKALETLLNFGGVDVHIIDAHKMTSYQIALNCKNDVAIRLLMSYEANTKKRDYLNREALNEGIYLERQESCCESMLDCVYNCLSLGMFGASDDVLQSQKTVKPVTTQQIIDYVQIGSKKQLPGYDVEWRRASEVLTGKITLFDSYNPFAIRENNFTIRNQLIVFQCISQQPWLLRKVIKADRKKNNLYHVHLHPQKLLEKVTVDDYIPFIKDRKEPMFVSDEEELWPMILQKGLAKLHKGYLDTNNLSPMQLLQEITGFHTIQIPLNEMEPCKLFTFLQSISSSNYIYFLRGKQKSLLREQEGEIDCFNILNFYEREEKELILVNCPFVQEEWKEKQKHEILALKLIKGHYNSHNQMCVWLQARQFTKYFSSVVVGMTFQNYEKTEMKMKVKQRIFCKYRVDSKRQEPLVMELSNLDNGLVLPLDNLDMMRIDGEAVHEVECLEHLSSQLAYVPNSPGEYMISLEVDPMYLQEPGKESNNLLLVCWSIDGVQMEFMEEEFGVLEWMATIRNRFGKIDEKCVVETIGQITLILLRENNISKASLRRVSTESEVLEGTLNEESQVQMITERRNIYYCVLRATIKQEDIIFDYE